MRAVSADADGTGSSRRPHPRSLLPRERSHLAPRRSDGSRQAVGCVVGLAGTRGRRPTADPWRSTGLGGGIRDRADAAASGPEGRRGDRTFRTGRLGSALQAQRQRPRPPPSSPPELVRPPAGSGGSRGIRSRSPPGEAAAGIPAARRPSTGEHAAERKASHRRNGSTWNPPVGAAHAKRQTHAAGVPPRRTVARGRRLPPHLSDRLPAACAGGAEDATTTRGAINGHTHRPFEPACRARFRAAHRCRRPFATHIGPRQTGPVR